ncbi:lipopolysaccharide assembly protein LapB [Aurantimonas sp. VKM B-3413]|uniref:tetratricopeptide repeat protein n=1 Tax=Aurantimonas sp. VKM B-3413 TaxID=2779401 RepID=UPI001E32DAE9|nr:tetratricopeptide repeat protein [Aurantimonas sp. VKM B-3413]MCB8839553.1 hypothetical protein [Aurantimonas sp. VKM B-3413]
MSKLVLSISVCLSIALGLPSAVRAAEPDAVPLPGNPATPLPGNPPAAGPDVVPVPGENSPMIIPAPDEDPEDAPEAFGSAPLPDEDTADTPTDSEAAAAPQDETREEKIDRLFAELKREPDAGKAARLAARIEREWRRSGSATVDLLMQRAAKAMSEKNTAAARDILDQTIVLAPDYAEAWNRRATLDFTTDQWGKSIADIEQTLSREPRHWGALMGLAMILERMDRKKDALETYRRVLVVYPALKSAQDAVGRLSDDLLGPAI